MKLKEYGCKIQVFKSAFIITNTLYWYSFKIFIFEWISVNTKSFYFITKAFLTIFLERIFKWHSRFCPNDIFPSSNCVFSFHSSFFFVFLYVVFCLFFLVSLSCFFVLSVQSFVFSFLFSCFYDLLSFSSFLIYTFLYFVYFISFSFVYTLFCLFLPSLCLSIFYQFLLSFVVFSSSFPVLFKFLSIYILSSLHLSIVAEVSKLFISVYQISLLVPSVPNSYFLYRSSPFVFPPSLMAFSCKIYEAVVCNNQSRVGLGFNLSSSIQLLSGTKK